MISCASLLVVLAGWAPALPAQERPGDRSGPLSPVLEARVARAIAEAWDVSPRSVQLSVGLLEPGATVPDTTPFRLLGTGEGGYFAVVFSRAGRPSLAVRIRAAVAETTAVAARPLSPHRQLAPDDVRLEIHTRWGRPRRDAPRPAAGWVVRRALAAGSVLEAPAVAPPPAVLAGTRVHLVWTRGTVTVALEGTALHDARAGETIVVRLDARRGERRGVVEAPGIVRLGT